MTAAGKPGLHFMHIGKTGGTAISLTLARERIRGYRLVIHGHDWTLRHLPSGDSVFFFVRDPVARFMSGFYSRYRQGQPRIHVPWSDDERLAFERFDTPNALARALSSDDFDERSAAAAAMKSIGHVRDGYDKWLGDESALRAVRARILFVGATERLDEDFTALRKLLHLPETVRLPKDDVASHRNPAGLDYSLDDVALANLRVWLGEDYSLLGVLQELFPELPRYAR